MRTLTPLSLLALTACLAGPTTAEDYAAVLPDEAILVSMPTDGATLRSAVGDASEYQAITSEVTHDVNGLIGFVLLSLDHVTAFDPTWAEEEEHKALWGPWTEDGVDGLVYVQYFPDEDRYVWAIEARPTGTGDDAWVPLVAGEVDPGATDTTGSGRFAIDFDAIADLDPSETARGAFYSEYDVQEDRIDASAAFEGFEDGGEGPLDALYVYGQEPGTGGFMDLVFEADITGTSTPEVHIVRSRWQVDGAGRADAYVTEGDLGPLVYNATECWDVAAQVVFYEDNADLVSEGDEAACAFAEPEWNESEEPGA